MERGFRNKMIIYKTTNKINGKIYVGQTNNNRSDYFGSGLLLTRAMKKYGRKNFMREDIEMCSTQHQLDKRERFWIKKLDSQNPQVGYNIDNGGNGRGRISEQTKKKMSISRVGKLSPRIGLKHTEETKNVMARLATGRYHTEETKRKLSKFNMGKNNYNYGKVKSEQTKNKISLANIKFRDSYSKWMCILISPNGKKHTMFTVRQFCFNNGLDPRRMCELVSGKRKCYNGWTGYRIERKINDKNIDNKL